MLLLQGSGLLPYVILAGTTSSPHSWQLKSTMLFIQGAALSALGNVTLLRSSLLLLRRGGLTGLWSHVQLSSH